VSTPTPDTPERPAVQEERLTVSRAALRLELLEMEVRLKDYFGVRLDAAEMDIRDLQEQGRITKAREEALAEETERRRADLADTGTAWSMRGSKAGIFVGIAAFGSLALAEINGIHTIFG
jgi:hypothetical protein